MSALRLVSSLTVRLTLIAALLLVGSGTDVSAFTPKTRAEIVRRTLTLMPPSLHRQLDKNARSLYEGALEPRANEQGLPAQARLQMAVDRLVKQVQSQASMAEIARSFGEIARASTDLSFALNVGPDDPRNRQVHTEFSRYVERMLPKMKLIFDGFPDSALRDGELEVFAETIARRAARDHAGVMRSYFPEGREPTTQDFDERSVAFAAASLETSLAMTATARTWLYAWKQASGDLSGAAYVGSAGPRDPFAPALLSSVSDAEREQMKE